VLRRPHGIDQAAFADLKKILSEERPDVKSTTYALDDFFLANNLQ
jgi:hypothetical protein